jgi:excisionase family DNA binding protein
MSNGVGRAILDELDVDDLDALAERLAPILARRLEPAKPSAGGWLRTKDAAAYLGVTVHALHRMTASRSVPFTQDGPGCRCWFRRDELDAWRRAGSPTQR